MGLRRQRRYETGGVNPHDVGVLGYLMWIGACVVGVAILVFAVHADTHSQISTEAFNRSKQNTATQVANCRSAIAGREAVRKAVADAIIAAYSVSPGAFQLKHNSVIPDSYVDEINRQLAMPRNPHLTPEQAAAPAVNQLIFELPPLRCTKDGKQVPAPIPTTTTLLPVPSS